jgi:hypothetical protein
MPARYRPVRVRAGHPSFHYAAKSITDLLRRNKIESISLLDRGKAGETLAPADDSGG